MCGINCPNAIVSVIIRIHAHTKWTRSPQGRSSPVVIVMVETVNLLRETFLLQLSFLLQFPLFLPQFFFFYSSSVVSSNFFFGRFIWFFRLTVAVLLVGRTQRKMIIIMRFWLKENKLELLSRKEFE